MTDVVDVVVVSLLVVGDDVLTSTGTNGFSEVDISFIDGSPEVETSAKVLFQLSHILKNSFRQAIKINYTYKMCALCIKETSNNTLSRVAI